jgi:hypothetical protein
MGIYDRDYMRRPAENTEPTKPRANLQKAGNKPSVIDRLKFWIWNLKNKK